MSLFRKRSGSQCSFVRGDDEISVSKNAPKDIDRESRSITIRSERSSCSDFSLSDIATSDSCVARNYPKHKSSQLRFLAWVAYTRKYTDEWITDVERRTCPLLWCRKIFHDEDSMLKHLPACPHLSKGQYWCFHCQKPERVGKLDCKRCQGLPSKTDRMASVAKKIFSKLGAKAHRHEHSAPSTEHEKSFGLWNNGESSSSGIHQQPKFSDDKSMSYWNDSNIPELPNTSICPEMPADIASHELDSNYICEMTGTELPFEMAIGDESCWMEDNFYTASLEDWDVDAESNVQQMPPPPVPRKSPKLARLDTSFTSLNTSMAMNYSIPQRHNSARFPETPISPTMISPLSATAMFSAGTFEVSPTDSEASGSSFFTDSGYSSATTTMSAWSCQAILDQVAESERQRGKKRARDDEPVFEDWIHDSVYPTQTSMLPPPAKVVAIELSQRLEDISSHDLVGCTSSEEPILSSPHWCDRPTFVHAFSHALDAHIDHTRAALKDLPSNSITRELSAMSKTSMVSIGLEALAGILEGRKPTAIVQVFAFTHISCAFVIATEHDEASVITETWFKDMLTWVDNLGVARQHQSYAQIARSIWKPCNFSEPGMQMELFSTIRKQNSLLTGCKHFLDIFEQLGDRTSIEAKGKQSDLPTTENRARAQSQVVNELKASHSPFRESVQNVERGLLQGRILSTRELELELMCAGKLAKQPGSEYQSFLADVSRLCDALYLDEPQSRTSHHIRDINLIKLLLPEESYQDEEHPENLPGHDFDIDMFIRDADAISGADQFFDRDVPVDTFQSQSQSLSRDPSSSSYHSLSRHTSTSTDRSSTTFHQDPTVLPTQPLLEIKSQSSDPPPPTISLHPPTPPTLSPHPPTPPPSSPTTPNKYRCSCGYSPSGEEKWKASNLRRHKRTQHAKGPDIRVYSCRYPGCVSTFTRSDNLKSHQRDKGHGDLLS